MIQLTGLMMESICASAFASYDDFCVLEYHVTITTIFSCKFHDVFLPLKSSHVVNIDAWHDLIEILAEYH